MPSCDFYFPKTDWSTFSSSSDKFFNILDDNSCQMSLHGNSHDNILVPTTTVVPNCRMSMYFLKMSVDFDIWSAIFLTVYIRCMVV